MLVSNLIPEILKLFVSSVCRVQHRRKAGGRYGGRLTKHRLVSKVHRSDTLYFWLNGRRVLFGTERQAPTSSYTHKTSTCFGRRCSCVHSIHIVIGLFFIIIQKVQRGYARWPKMSLTITISWQHRDQSGSWDAPHSQHILHRSGCYSLIANVKCAFAPRTVGIENRFRVRHMKPFAHRTHSKCRLNIIFFSAHFHCPEANDFPVLGKTRARSINFHFEK